MATQDKTVAEYRPIGDLRGWDKNPRAIKKPDFERLKRQIQKHGQFKPVLITQDGEVLGGNMRLKAYQELGITDVWVSVVEPKDEAEKVGIALADNDRAGYYVEEELAELLLTTPDLVLDDYHLDFGKTLSAKDFADRFQPTEEDDFDVEANLPNDPVSKLGDIYQLGEHRLMCGDSTDLDQVQTLTKDIAMDVCVTDPPYNFESEGGGYFGESSSNMRDRVKDIVDFDPFALSDIKSSNTAKSYYFFTNKALIKDYLSLFDGLGFNLLVWDKTDSPPMVNNNFLPNVEYVLYFYGKSRIWNNGLPTETYRKTYIGSMREGKKEGNDAHPTIKPIELLSRFIKISSHNGGTVLDLFGGSGSTLIACEQLDRKCYMMELDPRYVDVIIKRWEQFTGNKAELLTRADNSSGVTGANTMNKQ